MNFSRLDLISVFDLDFKNDYISKHDLKNIISKSDKIGEMSKHFTDSFSSLFYDNTYPGFEKYYFSFEKLNKNTFPGKENIVGCTLTINAENGIGAFSVWESYFNIADPLELKRNSWQKSSSFFYSALLSLNLDIEEIERLYPFMAIQTTEDNLNNFCKVEAYRIGQYFTGGYGCEEREVLEQIVRTQNISEREYERLFIQWTDSLAIYRNGIDNYVFSIIRSFQIFEICILIRRLLRNKIRDIENLLPKIKYYNPYPLKVNDLIHSISIIERKFFVNPPVSSVESQELLKKAYQNFGLFKLLEVAQKNCLFLDKRYQWQKTQILFIIGLIAYMLDNLGIYDFIKSLLKIKGS